MTSLSIIYLNPLVRSHGHARQRLDVEHGVVQLAVRLHPVHGFGEDLIAPEEVRRRHDDGHAAVARGDPDHPVQTLPAGRVVVLVAVDLGALEEAGAVAEVVRVAHVEDVRLGAVLEGLDPANLNKTKSSFPHRDLALDFDL